MTAVASPTSAPAPAPARAAAPVSPRSPALPAYRFELLKLTAQWRVRLAVLLCWTAPALFVAVVSRQAQLPTDTVFGRQLHASGWAAPLVVLGPAGTWLLPLLTSLVAGDVFAVEDRLGTWRHLLVAVRSPRRVFAAKATASLAVLLVLVAGLAVSSTAGGLLSAGSSPLAGLDGHALDGVQAARVVALAWLSALPATLAFAALGLLGSVVLGRSPVGLLLPAVLALGLQLAQLLPLPAVLRLALPSSGLVAWRGLSTSPGQTAPVLVGTVVGLLWAVVATALARAVFLRRDVPDASADGSARQLLLVAGLPLAALTALSVLAVSAVARTGGSGIDRAGLERGLATSFAHLYRLQTRELARPDVTEAHLAATAACDRGGTRVPDTGPGGDWRCVVSWHLPGTTAVGAATYQLDVAPDGRWVADGDGPKEVNGSFSLRTARGDAPNPLWQFDGLVDLSGRSG